MANNIPQLNFDRPVVDQDGSVNIQSRPFFRAIMDRALIIGSGSPETVVPALQGASYMDEDGALGNVFYIKQKDDDGAGDSTKEWKLIG